jgi:predicted amidohydrolase
MAQPLSLALVQAPQQHDGMDAFATRTRDLVRRHPGVRLLIHPELHLSAPRPGADGPPPTPADLAAPLEGVRDRTLAALAHELGVWLIPGSVYELGDDGRVYNTALVYSPAGERVATYRKIAPWRPYETTSAGGEFVVFDMPGHGRVGLTICYDAWFPEIFRHVAWMGADLIVNVVQTPTSDRAQEVVLARANAIVNQVFVASVNAAAPSGVGRSLLVDPQGRVLTEAPGAEESVLSDVIDLEAARQVRRYGTAGLNRVWEQFLPDDAPLDLPLYSGRIQSGTWRAGLGSDADRA